MKNIHRFGAGLNIEGGFPYRDLQSSKSTIWANLILVLDRPLIDMIDFDDIVKNNPYLLLENAIIEINERQFLTVYMLILEFYVLNGSKLVNKKDPTIVVHIHQDENCYPLIKIITSLLEKRNLMSSRIKFKTDKPNYQSMNHGKYMCDILISLSQCAGLDPSIPAGALLCSDTFIPLDLQSSTLRLDSKYQVKNSLIEHSQEIFGQDCVNDIVKLVNTEYVSANPNKSGQIARRPVVGDLHHTNIIQVDRLWNPNASLQSITIVQPNPDLVKQLSTFVSEVCSGRDESHGHAHMKEVAELSLEIGIGERASDSVIRLCQIVAWLHDVNDHKYDFDGTLTIKVQTFLNTLVGVHESQRVQCIIDRISFSKEVRLTQDGTVVSWMNELSPDELQVRNIVSDADKCTALGLKGFERCKEFTIEVFKAKNIPSSERDIIKNVVVHSFEKLLKLKDDYIRTKTGKVIAKPLHDELLKALQESSKVGL